MIEAQWWDYPEAAAMAEAVADTIGSIIDSAIDARGEALLAFPGGSTPRPVFDRLAKAELPWPRVTLFPGDERLVPPTSELSNARLIAHYFLARGARVVPMTAQVDDYRVAGDCADARLKLLNWPPDLVWLGMGDDGHTASIFPGPDLDRALDSATDRRAVGVMPDPLPAAAPVARVTLTKPAILAARTLIVTISGQAKRVLLEKALEDGPASALPIGRVLGDAGQAVAIHWCP